MKKSLLLVALVVMLSAGIASACPPACCAPCCRPVKVITPVCAPVCAPVCCPKPVCCAPVCCAPVVCRPRVVYSCPPTRCFPPAVLCPPAPCCRAGRGDLFREVVVSPLKNVCPGGKGCTFSAVFYFGQDTQGGLATGVWTAWERRQCLQKTPATEWRGLSTTAFKPVGNVIKNRLR